MVAWNIDYERDSEEVIFLKKHIAEQGWGRLFSSLFGLVDSYSITTSDSRNSTLHGQLLKTKNAFEDNKTALDETTRKVRYELPCI